ncbi:hypothetical protein EVAR_76405_1 [Eumeta japonica]|uniref:Mariner Mos1 transposase n=1 Tax=Eumeta variegata TaxID=151549 RepID=A0A4C1T7T0_EUMVA|nr:hypothetical protein EVAR_76405_1 [Eumeta japonica]
MTYYDFRRGLTQKQCIDQLTSTFGDEAPSNIIVYHWLSDKSWIYAYDPETKQQSTLRVFQDEPNPTKKLLIERLYKRTYDIGRKGSDALLNAVTRVACCGDKNPVNFVAKHPLINVRHSSLTPNVSTEHIASAASVLSKKLFSPRGSRRLGIIKSKLRKLQRKCAVRGALPRRKSFVGLVISNAKK